MILVDYSQVALGAILSFKRELAGSDEQVKNLIRHVILSTLKTHKKKYRAEYGEFVLCCDGRNYWRKEVFPYYKSNRKKARDASDLNWSLIFDTMAEVRDAIATEFPWRVIHIDRAEGDDVIAVMTRWCQTNQLITQGLVEESQKILIVSSDGDFKQLHVHPGVRQWAPAQKKFVTATKTQIAAYLIEHIVKGDSGDGIPNILSPDNSLADGIRQKSITQARLGAFIERGYEECKTEDERRNWSRNKTLVNFDSIPADITDSIIASYIEPNVGTKSTAMNYLIKHRCRLLLDEIDEF